MYSRHAFLVEDANRLLMAVRRHAGRVPNQSSVGLMEAATAIHCRVRSLYRAEPDSAVDDACVAMLLSLELAKTLRGETLDHEAYVALTVPLQQLLWTLVDEICWGG